MAKWKLYRDAGTGEYVTREYAEQNPATTYSETHATDPGLGEDKQLRIEDEDGS